MKSFQNILFPIDLSDTSVKMVPFVKTAVQTLSARLHLLFVVRDFAYFSDVYVSETTIATFKQNILEGAEKSLQEFRRDHLAALPDVQLGLRAGDIAEEILAYAADNKIDLLLLGTHGRKGLEKIFFGSVAERVLKSSPLPVLLVNPYRYAAKRKASVETYSVKRILIPVDLSEISSRIVGPAKGVAEAFGADMTLLSVARTYSYFNAMYVPDHTLENFEREVLEGRKRKMDEFRRVHFENDANVRTRILSGDIPETILQFGESENADLIIMGTHGRKALNRVMFGSVAERVAKSAAVPVLLIKPEPKD